jgi:hypothetical protein
MLRIMAAAVVEEKEITTELPVQVVPVVVETAEKILLVQTELQTLEVAVVEQVELQCQNKEEVAVLELS